MPPKNTSTGGYWREDPTDVPHKDVETNFETGESPKPETPTSYKEVTTSDNPEDDLVAVSHDSTPSPTVSDILFEFHLEDNMKAHSLASIWREAGLTEEEVKEKLKMSLEAFDRDRKAKERKEVEEMMSKYEQDEDEDENHSDEKGKRV